MNKKNVERDMLELLVLWAWQGIHISKMRACELLKISYYDFVNLQEKHKVFEQVDIEEELTRKEAVKTFLAAKNQELCIENRAALAKAFNIPLEEAELGITDSPECFAEGCCDYHEKLFGYSPTRQKIQQLEIKLNKLKEEGK